MSTRTIGRSALNSIFSNSDIDLGDCQARHLSRLICSLVSGCQNSPSLIIGYVQLHSRTPPKQWNSDGARREERIITGVVADDVVQPPGAAASLSTNCLTISTLVFVPLVLDETAR
jgi:hypothetical protein